MPSSSSNRDPLEVLAEEFVARHRAGELPPVEEYVARLPERAEEIRDLFPALLELEQLKPSPSGTTQDAPVAAGAEGAPPAPEAIGEFQILREIGRGGMGIVYEAVQGSLGRHVALKLLPAGSLHDPRRRERFRREARAAARLHHTNIVPVFGSGEIDGVPYYAMQFIRGQGLDLVISELQRLRRQEPVSPLPPVDYLASTVDDSSVSCTPSKTDPITRSNQQSGTTDPVRSGPQGRAYWESVARLGMQAAGALAHAHAQGVLHRDIKPSNLLLDERGTLWVADFGLAKLEDDENLTTPGDILGTLRYMAPERFEGRCDARADTYALGLTLYELVTLRPAFDETGREKLIAQVTQGEPPPPSRLNPHVPRDLETVIQKAMARDPGMRYASADDLAEDLQRFVDDRPIRARREGPVARLMRWSRRNPLVASLTAALAAFLLVTSVGSTFAAFAFWDLAEKESTARSDAEQKGQKIAADLERLNQANGLFESGLRHAVRKEWAQALADYTEATELRPDHSQVWSDRAILYLRLGLLDEAAADFERLFQIRQPNEPSWWFFHAVLRLNRGDLPGYRAVCRAMRQAFPEAISPEAVRALVRACILAPEGCEEPEGLLRLVDLAADRFPADSFEDLRVGLQYRMGDHREVVLATTPAKPGDRSLSAALMSVRARSLALSGQPAPAQIAFTGATEKLDAAASLLSLQPFGPSQAERFVGAFPPAVRSELLADWLVDLLFWQEAGRALRPEQTGHPLPLLIRARGEAALGHWDRVDPLLTRLESLCLADEQALRIPEVALVERARLNAVRGRWAEVNADLERAEKCARPDYPLTAQVTALYTAFGRDEQARQHLTRALAQSPRNLQLRLERGRASSREKNWDAAAEDLNAILTDSRWDPPRSKGFGGGFSADFFQTFDQGIRPLARSAETTRQEVRKEIVRHEELFQRILQRRPQDTDLRLLRGQYLLDQKRWKEALAFYLELIDNPPPGSSPAGMVASICSAVAPWDEVFEPIARKHPNHLGLWTTRAEWLRTNGDLETAADIYERILPPVADPAPAEKRPGGLYQSVVGHEPLFKVLAARRPHDADLWMARFRHAQVLGKPDERWQTAVEVLRRNGTLSNWSRELVEALRQSPEPAKTLRVCEDLAQAHPDYPEIHLACCLLQIQLGKWDEAAHTLATVLDRLVAVPTHPWLGPDAVYFTYLPAGEQVLTELLRRRPTDSRLWVKQGRHLASLNQDATPAFLRATELAPENPDLWLELARAQLAQKRIKEAAQGYAQALNRLPPCPLNEAQTNPSVTRLVYGELCNKRLAGRQGEELFLAVAELRPIDGRLWLEYARQLRQAGWNPNTRTQLVQALDELVKRAPRDPYAWIERARFRMSQKDLAQAADDYAAACKLLTRGFPIPQERFPDVFPVYRDIISQPELFNAYTARVKDDPYAWFFRAGLRLSSPNHPDHAGWESDLLRVIEILPDDPFPRHYLRYSYLEMGQWEKAAAASAAEFKRQEPPRENFLWVEAACAYAVVGQTEAYQKLTRRMEAVWQTPEIPQRCLQLAMAMAISPDAAMKPEKVLKLAKTAFDADATVPWNNFTLALAHCRNGQAAEGVAVIRRYLPSFDANKYGRQESVLIDLTLALALAQTGEKEEARAIAEAAGKAMTETLFIPGPNPIRRRMSPGHAWAIAEVLQREVQSLLKDGAPAPGKWEP